MMKKINKFYPKLTISGCDNISVDTNLEEKLEIVSQSIDINCDDYDFNLTIKPHIDKFSIEYSGNTI
jgi:hypothetical protein